MRELYRSLKIFTGRNPVRDWLKCLAVVLAAGAVSVLLDFSNMGTESDIADFMAGLFSGIICIGPVFGVLMISAIYAYNIPTAQGYKYLHSIADSDKHYLRAIIAANIGVVGIALICIAAQLAVCALTQAGRPPILETLFMFMSIAGIINLIGSARQLWLRMLCIAPVCFVSGMVFGNYAADSDSGIFSSVLVIPAIIIAVALYIAGIVYALMTSAKKWRRCNEGT